MIQVLNAGYVKMVRSMGGDNSIIEGARMCFQTESNNQKANEMLIKSIIKQKHTSPLEHCCMTFEVKLPLFVRDQWVRHRIGMSYNIMSLRYCEANPEFFIPQELEPGTDWYNEWVNDSIEDYQKYQNWIRFLTEKKRLSLVRAKELARTKLPTEIYTKMLVTCNMASLVHFLDLRNNNHAQPEIQLYAKALIQLASQIAPTTIKSYLN